MTVARVRVPCSTSNLGAGFDCVGVALDWWLEAEASLGDGDGVTFERGGTLAGFRGDPRRDLLWRGFALACEAKAATPPPALRVRATSAIPVARGLGSSAAALVAGALLADALLGLGMTRDDVVTLCAGVEGHPDNVAPMVLGGAVLAVPDAARGDGRYAVAPLDVHPGVGFALVVPDFETSTRQARAMLPATLPHRAAVVAAGKAAALVRGLATGDAALLAHALDDVLHVPFRRALVPGYDGVVAAAREAGAWGTTLSGSGSTLIALTPPERAEAVAAAMAARWEALGARAAGRVARVAPGAEVIAG
jgi:homoserine kinase